MQNDPLWNLRHALAGVGLAPLLSVPLAALLGSALGDAVGGGYGWRAGVYGALLLYVVAGAFVLFAKVARHETRPLSVPRVGLWLASLWLWPGLLLVAKRAPQASEPPAVPPAPLPGSGQTAQQSPGAQPAPAAESGRAPPADGPQP